LRRKAGKALLLLLACVLTFAVFNGILFQKKVNSRPLPSFYKKGVFHLHSTFSDGLGTIEEICRDARRQNLDFVILTDHGRPNRPASVASGWNQETLLIGASEFSLQAGTWTRPATASRNTNSPPKRRKPSMRSSATGA